MGLAGLQVRSQRIPQIALIVAPMTGGLPNSAMNLSAFLTSKSLPPPTVARQTRVNFTVGGCLAFSRDSVVLSGPQVIATPLDPSLPPEPRRSAARAPK